MKVILNQDIKGIGKKYDVKEVSDGYATNYLIPKKLAEYSSAATVRRAEAQKSEALINSEISNELFRKQMEMLKGVKIKLQKKATAKGRLYETIHESEISDALRDQAKIDIAPELIRLDTPIKDVGERSVKIESGEIKGEFMLLVEVEK